MTAERPSIAGAIGIADAAAQPAPRARLVRDGFDILALLLLLVHAVYWTVMPSLVGGSFALDPGETLFWAREWQLGYYKHPPLMAWLAKLGVIVFGRSLATVYLIPQLCLAAAFAAVWWLARRLVSPAGAFLSVAALVLFLPFTITSTAFNANVALLPFWAWAVAFAWTALEKNAVWCWVRLGLVLGLGLLAKYSVLLLAASFGLYCILSSGRRWVLRASGPWIALAVALLVASPHLSWLATVSADPLGYVVEVKGARGAAVAPLSRAAIFIAHQLAVAIPLLAVVAVWALASGRGVRALLIAEAASARRREALRFLLFVTFGPVVLTVAAALALGKEASPGWSYTFPITAGLLAVLAWPWLERDASQRRIPHAAVCAFAAGALAFVLAWPIPLWAKAALGLPAPRTAYDGAAHGAIVDEFWAKRRDGPLRYQVSHFGGSEERVLGSSTAYFSRHRPSVFHGADLRRSPWIDLHDFHRHGGVLISEAPMPAGMAIAGLCVTDVERFERPTRYPGYRPAFFHVGLLLPAAEPRMRCP